jgi:hypothetical protein
MTGGAIFSTGMERGRLAGPASTARASTTPTDGEGAVPTDLGGGGGTGPLLTRASEMSCADDEVTAQRVVNVMVAAPLSAAEASAASYARRLSGWPSTA